MPIQQLSRMVDCINHHAYGVTAQYTVKIIWEKLALHQAECVQGHLGDQDKPCRSHITYFISGFVDIYGFMEAI